MPIAGAAALTGAASIGSALIGSSAAKDAAQAQAQAAAQALEFQKQVYAQNQSNLQPWMSTGGNAAYSLANLYGLGPSGSQGTSSGFDAFTQLPAYQFPLQQGLRALTMNLNAQGKTQSGAEARETQQFGQGLASSYLMSNYVQPLQAMSGLGAQAAGSLAGTNANMSNTIGNTTMGIGQANAAGIVGSANALTGGLQGGANSLALYSLLAKNGGSGLSATYGNGSGTTSSGQSGWTNFGNGGTMYPTFG